MATRKPSTTHKHNQAVMNSLLNRLSETSEGKALVDFARDKKIKFIRGASEENSGYWNPAGNTLFLAKNIQRDEALGALAHELRHAWQTHSVKNLGHVIDRNLHKTNMRKSVMLFRAMEADAYSYQLATCVDLHNKGIVTRPPQKTFSLAESEAELDRYVREFAKKHGKNPFSAVARKESFLFFQKTRLFSETYDDYYSSMARSAERKKLTEMDFDYAAIIRLPSLKSTFNKFSESKVSTPKIKYLHPRDHRHAASTTAKSLHPKLEKALSRIDEKTKHAKKNLVRRDYDVKKLLNMTKRA